MASDSQAGIAVEAQAGLVRITVRAAGKRVVLRVTTAYARSLANEIITAAFMAEDKERDPVRALRDLIAGRSNKR